MRLTAITAVQRHLLAALTGRISTWLAAEFEALNRPESPNVGVTLAERGKRSRLEIPYTLLEVDAGFLRQQLARGQVSSA